MSDATRAVLDGETDGLISLLVDTETERFLGASALGTGDEIVQIVSALMHANATYHVLADMLPGDGAVGGSIHRLVDRPDGVDQTDGAEGLGKLPSSSPGRVTLEAETGAMDRCPPTGSRRAPGTAEPDRSTSSVDQQSEMSAWSALAVAITIASCPAAERLRGCLGHAAGTQRSGRVGHGWVASPPMTPAWIELEGAHNARDLGGLPTPDGPTRPGVLLRADALDALTVDDVERLTAVVGLAHVIDLRSSAERDERGRGRLGETGVRYTELEVIGPADLERRRLARAAAYAEGRAPAEIMSDGYVELLELGAEAFVEGFHRIVEPGGAPVLVHCAAGKDRTGVMVALLLDVAGVERSFIVEDYAASDARMTKIVERIGASASYERPADDEVQAFMFGALAPTMERFAAHLDARWGGGAGFFQAHGVDDDALERWRSLFIDPTSAATDNG